MMSKPSLVRPLQRGAALQEVWGWSAHLLTPANGGHGEGGAGLRPSVHTFSSFYRGPINPHKIVKHLHF